MPPARLLAKIFLMHNTRSFSQKDEIRLRPTLDFLSTFEKAGFFCQSAEPAEVEAVSHKVRRIIEESDVFIGFFTKRHPVFEAQSRFGIIKNIFKQASPSAWSAPPWVLQESGYALAQKKKLILLREVGVEIPGLQAIWNTSHSRQRAHSRFSQSLA